MKNYLQTSLRRIASAASAAVMLLTSAPAARSASGDLDPLDAGLAPWPCTVNATVIQPDGKIIIGGLFTSVLGVPRNRIARLNADGTLDLGFDPNADGRVTCLAIQANGQVLLGGSFTSLQPNGADTATVRRYIARVNADGTLDMEFNPNPSWDVDCIAVQTDGRIILGGSFSTLQPNGAMTATERRHIARINGDGTLDTAFSPNADDDVNCIALQADGKVLLGGRFTALRPNGEAAATTRLHIARVYANGTLDTGFNPRADLYVFRTAVQADGKVLLGGSFTSLQPNGASIATTRRSIARVNPDGTLDAGFDPNADDAVTSLAIQADGKVLLGGSFTSLQPNGAGAATVRRYIARINPDGMIDSEFDPNPNLFVQCLAAQTDGKILLGG